MASFGDTHGPLNDGIELNRQEAGLHQTALGGLEIAAEAATGAVIACETAQAAQSLATEELGATQDRVDEIAVALGIILGRLEGIENDMRYVAESDGQVKSGIEVASAATTTLKNTVGSDGTVTAAESNARERAYDASQTFASVAGDQPPAPLSYSHYTHVRTATTTELPALSSQVHILDEIVAPLIAAGDEARKDHGLIALQAASLRQTLSPMQEIITMWKALCQKSVGESALLSAGLVRAVTAAEPLPDSVAQVATVIGDTLVPGTEEVHAQAVDALKRYS